MTDSEEFGFETDPVSDKKLEYVYPELALRWRAVRVAMWNAHNLQIRVTAGTRSYMNQNELYAIGRKKEHNEWKIVEPRKVITNAQGGFSYHNFGLAVDSCFMGDDPYLERRSKKDQELLWKDFGTMARGVGMVWGGDFKSIPDRPHCELPYLSLAKCRDIFNTQGIIGIFKACKEAENCGRELQHASYPVDR